MIQIQTVYDIKNYTIIIKNHQLITTNFQIEAVAAFIGSYELFNIEYPAKVRTMLEVLIGLSFRKKTFSFLLAVKRFFNEDKLNGHGSL